MPDALVDFGLDLANPRVVSPVHGSISATGRLRRPVKGKKVEVHRVISKS